MAKKEEKFLSLKTDWVFKELMRNEEVRKYFISDVLDIPLEEIRSVRLENTFLSRRSRKEKQGILDVRVMFNDESKINIELQIRHMDCWDKRSIFYMAKMYTENFYISEPYNRLKRCIVISILGFAGDPHPGYHKVYQLRDRKGRLYSDQLEVHIIELNKKLTGERMDDWIRLINAESLKEMEKIQSGNPGINAAIKEVRAMNLRRWLQVRYDMYLMARADQLAFEATARRIGLEEGREQGEMNQSRRAILELLEDLGEIPMEIRDRIERENDREILKEWHKAAARIQSFDAFQKIMK